MASRNFTLQSTSLNSIRALPSNSYLVHATNCIASWGAGIAAELAEVFPEACKEYKKFCTDEKPNASSRWPPQSLAGQCLIIQPKEADVAAGAPSVHIVCLFTSYGYGRPNSKTGKPGRDEVNKILVQTKSSLVQMRDQIEMATNFGANGTVVIYSPKFNSGAFRVPWEQTSRLVEESFAGWEGSWLVMAPP